MTNTVLIVDDESNLLDSLRRLLRREPYRLLTSTSCEEALHIFETTPINVVISDQDMPGMSGILFLKGIRERYPETIRFMLTGKATLDSAIDAINAGGISRFFLKPCNPITLAAAIREGLQQHELMAAAYQLLQKNKRQSEVINRLEIQFPDISRVERDADGVIRVEDFHGDINQLLAEIYENLKEEASSYQQERF
jgi:two-component system, probable response regulator PhcQ